MPEDKIDKVDNIGNGILLGLLLMVVPTIFLLVAWAELTGQGIRIRPSLMLTLGTIMYVAGIVVIVYLASKIKELI